MEEHCSTGQNPQWAVVSMGEEEEEIIEECICRCHISYSLLPKRVQTTSGFYFASASTLSVPALLHRKFGLFTHTKTEILQHHCIHTPKRNGCHLSLWWFFGPIFRSGHSPCQSSQTFLIFTRISHAL